jgi:hypothetical protein
MPESITTYNINTILNWLTWYQAEINLDLIPYTYEDVVKEYLRRTAEEEKA